MKEPIFSITTDGHRYSMVLPAWETDCIQSLLASQAIPYELAMLQAMGSMLGKQDLVLDVGANIGNHALYLAAVVGCRVVVFEPNPGLCDPLRKSITLNDLDERVKLVQKGVGAVVGKGAFTELNSENSGRKAFTLIGQEESFGDEAVDVTPLDAMMFDQPVRAIRIGIEGIGLDVLAGARALIERDRPALFIEAGTENQFLQLQSVLHEWSYVYWDTFNASPTHWFLPQQELCSIGEGYGLEQECDQLKQDLQEARQKYRAVNERIVIVRDKLNEANVKYRKVTQQYNDIKQTHAEEKQRVMRWLHHAMIINEQSRLLELKQFLTSSVGLQILDFCKDSALLDDIAANSTGPVLCVGAGVVAIELAALCVQYDNARLLCLEESPAVSQEFSYFLAKYSLTKQVEMLVVNPDYMLSGGAEEKSLLGDSYEISLVYINSQLLLCDVATLLPTIAQYLAPKARIWLDNTIHQKERDTHQHWADLHGFELEYYPLDKALPSTEGATNPEFDLDFSLPEDSSKG